MEATKSVVRILSEYKRSTSTGSGFVIKNDGEEVLIATNNHVVEDNPKRISVWVRENRQVDAQIVFTTPAKDLCVLRLTEAVDMVPLTLSKEEAQHGEAIYAVGYPGVADILSDTEAHTSESATITDGIISAIRTLTIEEGAEPIRLLQINAAINSGNSGGPLFNSRGEVIGVNTYGIKGESQGVFGSVDISELWGLLEEHNIDIGEGTSPKTVETTESAFMEISWKSLMLSGSCVAILLVVLFTGIRRKKGQTHLQSRKSQTTTLKEYIASYPQGLGITGAVSILLPAAIQLRNLHNDGKLHLQICPENILIGNDGAFLRDPSSQEAERYNFGFAAPEIYKGAGFGVTSDIYSFAAVVLYAATGKVPGNSLQSDTPEQDFTLLEDAAFAAMIRKAMESNLPDRTQSMQELIYGIAVYNVPAQKNPQPMIMTDGPALRNRKSILLPMTAVLACGIIAVLLLWKPVEKTEEAVQIQSTEQTEATVPMTPEEIAYAEAEALLAEGKTAAAAIAFAKLGDYEDARERSFELWALTTPQETLIADFYQTTAIHNDGTVSAVGYNNAGQCYVDGWSDIVAISGRTVGLRGDGTVVATGSNEYGKHNIGSWTGIVAISAGGLHTVGLRSNGTVVAVGDNNYDQCEVDSWIDIVAIGTGYNHTVGLRNDGTVIAVGKNTYGQCEVDDWTDIVTVCVRGSSTLGLRSDGTVVAVGVNTFGQCGVDGWTDIVAIDTGEQHSLGLRSDGTVVAVGDNTYGQCNVDGWTDIVAISAGYHHSVGLRSDGTVVATGSNEYGICNVGGWTDIVAISAGNRHTVGLRSDGTAVVTGNNKHGQCNISDWTDIKLPE